MGLMRRSLPFALFSILALPAAAETCDEFATFSSIKAASEGLVQDALGALPNSELNGTFNRFSALFNRGQVRDLCVDDSSLLPSNFAAGRDAALADLKADLEAAIDAFADGSASCDGEGEIACAESQYVILQLVAQVVVERHVDLYYSDVILGCDCSHCPPGSDPEFCQAQELRDLRDLVDLLIDTDWWANINALMDERGHLGYVNEPSVGFVGGILNFRDAVVGGGGSFVHRATGVEEIQYDRVTGVPSIDD